MQFSNRMQVGVLVGSLRRGSYSRQIARALIARAPDTMACDIIEIGELPLYNQDLDSSPPPAWVQFRKSVAACDALLFVTPEYNRSVPGCLKNATDVGSRPQGESVFAGLPAAVVSVSPYALGGFGANHALRQNFVYLDLAVMQQPEAYLGNVADALDDKGQVTNPKTDEILVKFMRAFERWASSLVTADEDFAAFLSRREAASNDYITGDPKPLLALSASHDPATFFPPSGDRVLGAAQVNASNEQGAKAFKPGGVGRFDIFQQGSSGGLAYWTGLQHADVRMPGKDAPVNMTLRTTEIFRVENGAWKLIHRHADKVPPDR